MLPKGQTVQVAFEVSPEPEREKPGRHVELQAPTAPVEEENVPGEQGKHAKGEAVAEKVPAGQVLYEQLEAPAVL